MIAVVETEEFLADVKGVLSEDQHDNLILYVAHHPEAGDLIPATGGLKEVAVGCEGQRQTRRFASDLFTITTLKCPCS